MSSPAQKILEESLPTRQTHRTAKKQLGNNRVHLRAVVTEPNAPAIGREEDPEVYGVPGHIQPVRKPRSTDSNAPNENPDPNKRTDPSRFGTRYLEEGDDIFAYNAWDQVEADAAYEEFAAEQYRKQREAPVSEYDKKRFNGHPDRWWNKFYSNNHNNFFKDRKWLFQEYPILNALTSAESPPALLVEVGAGAGNSAYPILARNSNIKLRVHACDFSKTAVEVIRSNAAFDSPETVGLIEASVWDVASEPKTVDGKTVPCLPEGIEPGSVDVIMMVFVLSALEPRQWERAMRNLWAALRPGGLLLFRDYGRGDLAQVRFKAGRYLDENFYIRGDGTRVYFFDENELKELWARRMDEGSCTETPNEAEKALEDSLDSLSLDADTAGHVSHAFEISYFTVDRRMLVNRQRRLKMFRCWMQAILKKPEAGMNKAKETSRQDQ